MCGGISKSLKLGASIREGLGEFLFYTLDSGAFVAFEACLGVGKRVNRVCLNGLRLDVFKNGIIVEKFPIPASQVPRDAHPQIRQSKRIGHYQTMQAGREDEVAGRDFLDDGEGLLEDIDEDGVGQSRAEGFSLGVVAFAVVGDNAEGVAFRREAGKQAVGEKTRVPESGDLVISDGGGRQSASHGVVAMLALARRACLQSARAPDVDRAVPAALAETVEDTAHGDQVAVLGFGVSYGASAQVLTEERGELVAEIRLGTGPMQADRGVHGLSGG